MSRQSFIYGAMLLLAASIFNRMLGFIYQIIIIRMIEPEGVGLFNMVFPIYILALVISTLGIPLAISKLVAEEAAKNNLSGAYRIFKLSLLIIITSSTLLTFFLITLAPAFEQKILPDPRVHYCFLGLVPGIFIVSLCSAFRGFFQGLQRMAPTAITQALEQVIRVAAGLTFAYILLPRGIEYAAAGMSLGVVCGETAGLALMLWIYYTRRPHLNTGRQVFFTQEPLLLTGHRIFQLGIPVTLTRFVSTSLMSIDAVLIPRQLQIAGLSIKDATSAYGQFVGISETLLFTPGVVTIALSTALVPAVSQALAQQNLRLLQKSSKDAVHLTILMGLPMAAIFLVVPTEICQLLFGYPEAGKALMLMALSGPFIYLQQTTTGILQGLGRAFLPFKNMMAASIIKILGIYYLTPQPRFGIMGTALSLGAYFVCMSILNYRDLKKITGFKLDVVKQLIKPCAAAAISAITMYKVKMLVMGIGASLGLCVPLTILAGALSYILVLVISGGINPYDLSRFKSLYPFKT